MTPSVADAAGLAGIALLVGMLVGLALGMFFGERGRRIAAERMAVTGTPDRPAPRRVSHGPGSEELAQGVGKVFTEDTVERGAERLLAEAQAEGKALTPAEARDQARYMLDQLMPFGGDDGDVEP